MQGVRSKGLDGFSLITAVLTAALILFSTSLAAEMLRSSGLYGKSRLISMIVSRDEIGISDMAGNRRNVDMMFKFIGALTSAYIDFEMIPVDETGAFAAVFESIPPDVSVEKFEYRRKSLIITGAAASTEAYAEFLGKLRGEGYFEGVTGHFYLDTGDVIRFELECAPPVLAGAIAP